MGMEIYFLFFMTFIAFKYCNAESLTNSDADRTIFKHEERNHNWTNFANFTSTAASFPNFQPISEYTLAKFLFNSYSRDCRPRANALETIDVQLGISLYAINEIIEKSHEIVVTASLAVQWRDDFLRWNDSTPYNQIELVAFPNKRIWLPDIALTNSGDIYAFMLSRGMMAVIQSNGAVEYFPEATVTAFCQFDLTFFPFDIQMCEFYFESWSYIIVQQNIHLLELPVNTKRFTPNEQWDLIDTGARAYTACYSYTETQAYCYPGAVFGILLKRKADYYLIMIIFPSIIFSIVAIVSFSLPLAEVSKLQISFTCLLSYAVFQTTVRVDMPRTSENDPLLTIYFDIQMGFISFTLLGEALVFLALQRPFHRKRLHPILAKLFFIKQIEIETLNSQPPAQPKPVWTVGGKIRANSSLVSESNHQLGEDEMKDSKGELDHLPKPSLELMKNQAMSEFTDLSCQTVIRVEWETLAYRVENLIVIIYIAAMIIIPACMFLVYLLTEQKSKFYEQYPKREQQ